ncbi:MAG TPA: hypothetical protein VFF78_06820 [Anaerolineaceae bacterium]|nr:hypothetical protein [Anaerolineaceae bacterium]
MGVAIPSALILRLGQAAVAITCEDEQDARALRGYFYHCQERTPGPPPQVRYHVTHPSVVQWRIYRDDVLLSEPIYKQEVAEALMQDFTSCLIDGNAQQAALHAACLARAGQAVLVPAVSGSGKSTLAAWLLSRGWEYLTDELVLFDPHSGVVQGLPRPLALKKGSADLGRAWFPSAVRTEFPLRAVWIDPGKVVEQALAALLVFPNFQPGQVFQVQALSRAEAVFELLRALVNARHLPNSGLVAMGALAQRAPAFRLTYGALDETAADWFAGYAG